MKIVHNWMLYFIPCVLLVMKSVAMTTVDLSGQWTVSNSNHSISVSGRVPGSMYTALMDNKVIGDPYFRENDENYKWIGEENWTFSRNLTVSSELLSFPAIKLICEGLDTIATVKVNGKTVGTSENMFIRYVYDVKPVLRVGENSILVEFRSAPEYVEEFRKSLPYPVLPNCVHPAFHGTCGANLIRKTQCSFSWDWGPSFPTQGIWRNVTIQGYKTAALRDVTTETVKNAGGGWQLKVSVFMESLTDHPVHGKVKVTLNGTISTDRDVTLTPQNNIVTFDISVSESEGITEWMPNGYGNQTLYDVKVVYSDSQGTVDSKSIRIGFRTVELVQDFVSSDHSQGRTFYFRINGKPIYLKGSNWIPADSFLERVTRDRVYSYLKSASDAHMNALRVWGGGIYEFDMFYEIADELGIMIWQDFMFACSMYPAIDTFLDSVRQEVTFQVRRLKHHPSIIVWAGNNENEAALRGNWYGTSTAFERYKQDYIKLYIDTIRTVVQVEDISRPFLSSSPSNGIETEQEGWVAHNPSDTLYGDVHEYNYYAPIDDPTKFRVPRLCSEYGLQSFPSMESLRPVYDNEDLQTCSDLNEYRNHHPRGHLQMLQEAKKYHGLHNCTCDTFRFEDFIYITQIDQSIAMKTMTEKHRRGQNRLDGKGQGNTMGSMYWMLADIWQAPTWASLEYGGKWKMIHYYATNFFAPTLISPLMDNGDVNVFIAIDELPVEEVRHEDQKTLHFRPQSNPRPFSSFDMSTWSNQPDVEGATDEFAGNLYIEMYDWRSLQPLKTWKVPFRINSTSESVYRRNANELLTEASCNPRSSCVLYFHLGDFNNGPTNWLPYEKFALATGVQTAHIQVTEVKGTSEVHQFSVTITTDNIAPFVWLEAAGVKGRFSDNGFLMFQSTKTLTFYAWQNTSVDELKSALSVKSWTDVKCD